MNIISLLFASVEKSLSREAGGLGVSACGSDGNRGMNICNPGRECSLSSFGRDPWREILQLQITPDSFHSLFFLFSDFLSHASMARQSENKNPIRRGRTGVICRCGERGIRTPGTLLRYTRFPGVPVKPLLHLSLCPPKL